MSAQPMSFGPTAETEALRRRLRDLIRAEVPDSYRGAFVPGTEAQEVANRFCRRLAEEGLLTLNWPRRYGGAEASVWEQTVLREEMWAHHEPRGVQYMGLNWVGPAIMRFGTQEQRDHHLSAIAAGTSTWCQGFSEPGSGSDLASLQLAATPAGDGSWRLKGQKIWTSYAGLADYCFLLARTDRSGPRQHGITVFLIPMDREGITVRPIDAMIGAHHLNEVFFDDVVAYDDEILGKRDHGWAVVRYVLDHERIGIARYARADRMLRELAGHVRGESIRNRHAWLLVKARTARLMNYRSVAAAGAEGVPAGVSVARLATTLLDQDVADFVLEALGEDGLSDAEDAPGGGWLESAWRYARASTIASGTAEIQRMLAAKAMTRRG